MGWSELEPIRKFEGDDRLYTTIRRFYRYPAMDEYYSVFPPIHVI